DPAAVLLEPDRLRGDTPPRRKAGQDVAPTISARTKGGGGLGTDFDCDGGLIASTGDVAHCLNAGAMGRIDYETETMIAHSLRGEGFDASEDGTGRGTPLVSVAFDCKGTEVQSDASGVSPPLRSMGRKSSHQNAGGHAAIAIQERAVATNPESGPQGAGFRDDDTAYTLEARNKVQAVAFAENQQGAVRTADVVPALSSGGGKPGQGYPAVAFDLRGREGGEQVESVGETVSLRAADGGSSRSYVADPWAVRRLTPKECHRLQGFSDDHCLIPTGKSRKIAADELAYLRTRTPEQMAEIYGVDHETMHEVTDDELRRLAADGPQYKALGNSMAVPCVKWIMDRMRVSMGDVLR
ncbi:MAG: hypothetical protein ACPGSI_17790, partial [Pikeienuella sp.]